MLNKYFQRHSRKTLIAVALLQQVQNQMKTLQLPPDGRNACCTGYGSCRKVDYAGGPVVFGIVWCGGGHGLVCQ